MGLNYLAPSPYASFLTRNGAFQADVNGLISNVGVGAQAVDRFHLELHVIPAVQNSHVPHAVL